MRTVLFGLEGQLGFEISKRADQFQIDLLAPKLSELDLTNKEALTKYLNTHKPELILNAAAYTAVDRAEKERELAFRVNCQAVADIAEIAKSIGAKIIHVSTDYVFDGNGSSAKKETDDCNPINVYGESKLAGEKALLDVLGEQAVILRTSSLHGQNGHNFVHTMLKLFKERSEVKVVEDQVMSPTWAGWLAEVMLKMAHVKNCGGIYHACSFGEVSWFNFAKKIYDLAPEKISVDLIPISTQEFKCDATRPLYSVMDCSKLETLLNERPISWENGLNFHLQDLQVV